MLNDMLEEDMISGYWQIGLDPKTSAKSAFSTLGGLYQFEVMPFGLCNAPGMFQRVMDCILSGLQWSTCLVYLDDVVVFSNTFEDHLTDLEQVFSRVRTAGLKFKSKKCQIAKKELVYLGHMISEEGISTNPNKVEAVKHWPVPNSVKDVQKFLGLASYYRCFVQDFSTLAHPLTNLTHKGAKFDWTIACQEVFETLQGKLIISPILSYPDFSCPFILDTDSSDYGVGAVLSQLRGDKEVVITYFSKTLSKEQKNYSVTRKELLAVILSCEHFRHYLIGRKFKIRTDDGSLHWLTNFKEPVGQVARWSERLSEFDYEIEHRPGRVHCNADALSRHPFLSMDSSSNNDVESKLDAPITGNGSKIGMVLPSDSYADTIPSANIVQAAIQILPGFDMEQQAEIPEYSALGIHRRLCKMLWQQWDVLEVVNGILNRKLPGRQSQVILPTSLRQVLLQRLHDASLEGAHLGEKKTYSKVCQRKQPRKRDKAPLVLENPGYPFSRIAKDILGPLPITESSNRYILVVQDYFTKFVEAFAVPNQEVRTIAKKLVDEVFCQYGVPEIIHLDQGSNFESSLFSELCDILQITKTRTTPYHPQSDGMVERFNRTLISMLSGYVSDYGAEWDYHLPKVMMAYRSSVHQSTGMTPNFALFKSEISLSIEFVLGAPPDRRLPLHDY
ncbi:hypothetical protein ScPMuIL_012195, partial [Solemya velum]